MSSTEQPGAALEVTPLPQPSSTATSPVVAAAPAVKTPAKRVVRKVATKAVPPANTATSTAVKPAAKPAVRAVAKTTPKAATLPLAAAAPKAPAKTTVKTAVKVEPKLAKVPAVKPKSDKLLKDKKPKLVRDSFTIPKLEYLLLDQLKQRSGTLGTPVKKSELIRAGIKALAAMADANFLTAVKAVPTIKTGRPTKD